MPRPTCHARQALRKPQCQHYPDCDNYPCPECIVECDMEPLRENPYQMLNGSWWFYDENSQSWGPFETQLAALRGLLNYMEPRTRWQRIWDAFS